MVEFQVQNPNKVANFVIDFGIKSKRPVTNLKLQKILFFLQGYSLHSYHKRLIDGDFSKWKYGPVEEEVYYNNKENGSSVINSMSITINITKNNEISITMPQKLDVSDFKGNEDVFNALNSFTDKLLDKNVWELVDLTHNHKSWSKYKDDIFHYAAADYTNEEIRECYEDAFLDN